MYKQSQSEMDATEMLKAICKKHPPIKELFVNPDVYKFDTYYMEQKISEMLFQKIMYIFESNETPVEFAYHPMKGWGIGFTGPSGIKGAEFELKISEGVHYRILGHAALALLYCMVIQANYCPVILSKSLYARKKEIVHLQRDRVKGIAS